MFILLIPLVVVLLIVRDDLSIPIFSPMKEAQLRNWSQKVTAEEDNISMKEEEDEDEIDSSLQDRKNKTIEESNMMVGFSEAIKEHMKPQLKSEQAQKQKNEHKQTNLALVDMYQSSIQAAISNLNTTSPSSFSLLDELDVDAPIIDCGCGKCYFPSRKDDKMGFLVIPIEAKFTPLVNTYYIVKEWEREETEAGREFRHFYDFNTPPMKFDLTNRKSEKEVIFSKMTNLNVDCGQNMLEKAKAERYIMLLKVYQSPTPYIVAKCHNDKFFKQFKKFVTNLNIKKPKKKNMKEQKELKNFKRNIKNGLTSTVEFYRKMPCLTNDAQILIDKDGKVYQLDFDRCNINKKYKRELSKFETNCVPLIKEALMYLNIDDTVL